MSTPKIETPQNVQLGDNTELEIIWLHGWGQTHSCFEPLANLFKKKASNILIDLYGFGATPLLFKGAGTADYAEALRATILSKPKSKKRIIIGHSFGCRVAIMLASENPELADGYVLISGAGLKPKRSISWRLYAFWLRLLGKTASLSDKLFKTSFKKQFSSRFGSSDYKNAGDLRETFVRVVNEDLSAEALTIKQPVSLIYGDEDKETPPDLGQRYAKLIPQSSLKILNGYGHLDILNRGAHQCQTIINKFIESVEN